MRLGVLFAATVAIAFASAAQAQSPWTYRLRVLDEVTTERANPRSSFASEPRARWDVGNQMVATGDGSWERPRLKLAGGVALKTGWNESTTALAREAYARVSLFSWLDLEGGKRLLRWGTGYAFSPTGVLDPPRAAADPRDRLGLNEGMPLVRADLYRRDMAVTVAAAWPAASGSSAARRNTRVGSKFTLTRGGVELGLIGALGGGQRASAGANFTHVIGSRLEWHGELLSHAPRSGWLALVAPNRDGGRTLSTIVGLNYTFGAGLNLVVEYYRDGGGLDGRAWDRLLDRARALRHQSRTPPRSVPGPAPGAPSRRNFVFVRGARAAGDAIVSPDVITIVGLDDGSVTVVPTVTWTVGQHVQIYARGVGLAGPRDSAGGNAPTTASLMTGLALRF